jgi:hypothetical protein
MTRKNFYVLVDRNINKVLNHPVKLPENWENIHGMESLSDEELSDLGWAGHENFGWIKFDSDFSFTFEFAEYWLEFAKNSIKNEYAGQRWEAENRGILYKNILINTDERTKTAILLKTQIVASSPEKTFSWKHNNSTVEFTSNDIIFIANALNDYTQKCFDLEAALISQIDAVEFPSDLPQFDLEIDWPSNHYE